MDIVLLLKAAIMGLVEGLTEFLPVSSTGHLLLLQRFLGFGDEDFGKTFVVLIQLGAILAVVAVYFARLWKVLLGLPGKDPAARRFAISVHVALATRSISSLSTLIRRFPSGSPRTRFADSAT